MENSTATRRVLTIDMRNRFTVLLIFIVTLLSVLPLIKGDELAILSIKVVLSVVLLSGICMACRMRRRFIVATMLAIPVLLGRWLPQYSTDTRVFLASDILAAVFVFYITAMILSEILSARRVSLDTIAGAVCTYFLIGMAWAFVYRAMFAIIPHSFTFASGSFVQIFEDDMLSRPQLMPFVYYSFATLTTTGFGDITPTAAASRGISVLEAMAGQLFIAVLIARLVSLELSHSTHHE
jgi:voltage-gated potassium channel